MPPRTIASIMIAICLSMILLWAGGPCIGDPNTPQRCTGSHGIVSCDGEWVNIQIDANNCGKCGNACEEGYMCRGGKCVRTPPALDCNDGNPCTTDVWSRGRCVHTPKADGTECGDGACFEGVCYPEYASCLASGGTVAKEMCCKSAPDFPDTCLIGACGCSPENSKETLVCQCGDGMCFDGVTKSCVPSDPVSDCPGGCPDDGDLCTYNHRCENGKCVHDTIVCIALEGVTCCPHLGECVNILWDEENCGECGKECPGGWECCYGECQPICPADDPGFGEIVVDENAIDP